jgi:uncharacterized protein involved in type VI secretion and phage assembly
MPQVGDEVVIGFEHDDVNKPYVLGSLFNGTATPGDDLAVLDGSFSLQSDQKVQIHAKDVITVKSDKDFSVETQGKVSHKSTDDMSAEGMSVSVKANSTLTIEGTQGLTIKCGGAKIEMTPMGTISISGTQISLG